MLNKEKLVLIGFAVVAMIALAVVLISTKATVSQLGAPTYTEAQIVAFVEVEQADNFVEFGRYGQLIEGKVVPADESIHYPNGMLNKIPDDLAISVYSAPTGEGYQTIFYRYTDEEILSPTTTLPIIITTRESKSYGYGPEATNRTWDWREG